MTPPGAVPQTRHVHCQFCILTMVFQAFSKVRTTAGMKVGAVWVRLPIVRSTGARYMRRTRAAATASRHPARASMRPARDVAPLAIRRWEHQRSWYPAVARVAAMPLEPSSISREAAAILNVGEATGQSLTTMRCRAKESARWGLSTCKRDTQCPSRVQ